LTDVIVWMKNKRHRVKSQGRRTNGIQHQAPASFDTDVQMIMEHGRSRDVSRHVTTTTACEPRVGAGISRKVRICVFFCTDLCMYVYIHL
jgi:hypothetical protein